MTLPLISVIVPSLNQGRCIERTILSVLKQNYPAKELIVADGGSADGTVEILKKYPEIIHFSEPDRGFADAVNKGLSRCRGEIVGIQSSDDYYAQGAFRAAADAFGARPDTWFVAGQRVVIDSNLYLVNTLRVPEPVTLKAFLEMRTWVAHDAAFIRKEALDFIGGLDSEVDYVADFDLCMRLLAYRNGRVIQRSMSFYMQHDGQRTQAKGHLFARDSERSVENLIRLNSTAVAELGGANYVRGLARVRSAYWLNRAGDREGARSKLAESLQLDRKVHRLPAFRGQAKRCGLREVAVKRRVRNYYMRARQFLGRMLAKANTRKAKAGETMIRPMWIYEVPDSTEWS